MRKESFGLEASTVSKQDIFHLSVSSSLKEKLLYTIVDISLEGKLEVFSNGNVAINI